MTHDLLIQACPACGGTDFIESNVVLSEGALRVCRTCGHAISSCTLQAFDLTMREFENPQGTLPTERSRVRYRQRIGRLLRTLSKFSGVTEGCRLLDVGCSSGALLNVAREIGFDVQGVEPSSGPAQTAIKSGFSVFNGYLQDANFADDRFDVVTMMEVIEHLTEPLAVIREIFRILRPGGVLAISTGNIGSLTARLNGERWEYLDMSRHGGHVSFFTSKSLAKLANRAGFEIVNVNTRNFRLLEKAEASPLLYRSAKVLAELFSKPVGWMGQGHDLVVVLRKPQGSHAL